MTDPQAPPLKPLGLRLITWLLWFWAGASALLFFGLVVGEGSVAMRGSTLQRAEALEQVLPVLLPMLLGAAGAALALTLGKHWARPAVLMPLALAALAPAISGEASSVSALLRASLGMLVLLAVAVWYLFAHRPVRAYFAALRERQEEQAQKYWS